MSRASARTLVEAEQALTILRESSEPMTATAIGRLVGYAHLSPCDPSWHARGVVCQGDGTDLYVRTGHLGCHMSTAMNLLLRQGRVSREKVGARVYWSYVERPEDVAAARLVQQLMADAGSAS